jgi:hypothetical protein
MPNLPNVPSSKKRCATKAGGSLTRPTLCPGAARRPGGNSGRSEPFRLLGTLTCNRPEWSYRGGSNNRSSGYRATPDTRVFSVAGRGSPRSYLGIVFWHIG